jgi:hypothetical protein
MSARAIATAAAWAVFAGSVHAQSTQALEAADRLFERSGLAAQLQPLPEQFEQGLSQNRGGIPEEAMAALAEAGRKSFGAAALRGEIVSALAQTLLVADMKQVLAWLDGRVGRRMTLAEESAAGKLTQENMQAYFESEKLKPANPQRARLISDLVAAVNAVEIGAVLIEAMSLGIAVGMDSTQPVEKRIGIANLRSRLRAAMPPDRLRAAMSESIPAMYGFVYREIGDADLAAYLKFNNSPLGQRYNQAMTAALTAALARASVRVGEIVQGTPGRQKI